MGENFKWNKFMFWVTSIQKVNTVLLKVLGIFPKATCHLLPKGVISQAETSQRLGPLEAPQAEMGAERCS